MWSIAQRSMAAAGIALAVSMAVAPSIIRSLRRLKVGQVVRDDGPKSHSVKSGTPTMGGVIIVVAALVAAGAMARGFTHLPIALFVTTACGLVGMLDDYISIVARRPLGLRARHKLAPAAPGRPGAGRLRFHLARPGHGPIHPFRAARQH